MDAFTENDRKARAFLPEHPDHPLPETTSAVYDGEGQRVPMRHWPDIVRTPGHKGSVA